MTDIPNQQPLVTGPILEYVQALLRRSLTHEQARQEPSKPSSRPATASSTAAR
ncbi:hypothetical protein [Streptomyces zaomyceticus]|uniref:hypothetical protein n=1 Tax=Streptomyces zaomyceticus TaxID=68286 RepID=UPI003695A8DC